VVVALTGIAATSQAQATPKPVNGETVVVKRLKGKVLVKHSRNGKTHQLRGAETLKLKSLILDTRRGQVKLTAMGRKGDGLQTARIWGSRFNATQYRNRTVVRLGLIHDIDYSKCDTWGPQGVAETLWVDARGRFGTSGSAGGYASSDSAKWFTRDRCYTTRYQVQRGEVKVEDSTSYVEDPLLKRGDGYTAFSEPCRPTVRRCSQAPIRG